MSENTNIDETIRLSGINVCKPSSSSPHTALRNPNISSCVKKLSPFRSVAQHTLQLTKVHLSVGLFASPIHRLWQIPLVDKIELGEVNRLPPIYSLYSHPTPTLLCLHNYNSISVDVSSPSRVPCAPLFMFWHVNWSLGIISIYMQLEGFCKPSMRLEKSTSTF